MNRSALRRGERGAVAVMVAVCMVMLVIVAGAAIDFGRAYYVRSSLQGILDAAALAAAVTPLPASNEQADIDAALNRVAAAYISANVAQSSALVNAESVTTSYSPPDQNGGDTVNISLSAAIPTGFLSLVGINQVSFSLTSQAERRQQGPVDLALVIDTTQSMASAPSGGGDAKIKSLKAAATALVNQVMASGSPNIRVAVVPYSKYVNTGVLSPVPNWVLPIERSAYECQTWAYPNPDGVCKTTVYDCLIDGVLKKDGCTANDCSDKGTLTCVKGKNAYYRWNGCIGVRSVIPPINVADPPKNKSTDLYLDTIDDPTSQKYAGMTIFDTTCGVQEILPLTSNKQDVLDKIDKLTTWADTYIPSGLIWGWNVLTPEEPYTARTGAELEAVGGMKALVLMTDGVNSMSPRLYDGTSLTNGDGSLSAKWRDGSESKKLISKICTNIKADTANKIKIFTVAFDVTDANIKTILRDCASSSDGSTANKLFFDASSNASLLQAFQNIGEALKTLRLVQ
ncbi:MAG: pilus assembly protein TadG-related protein [Hyphomicrobiales bacterium]